MEHHSILTENERKKLNHLLLNDKASEFIEC